MIHKNSIIGKENKFGKNVIINENVIIRDNNYIGNNTVIESDNCKIEIGDNNYISDFCSIGKYPQHMIKKFEFEKNDIDDNKKIIIGSNNVLREFITVHVPYKSDITSIGSNCYLMDYCHIAHDCKIFDNVNIANNCQIGGHSVIFNNTTIGLTVTIHQCSTIGSYCMIGMGTVITKDIPPFLLVYGNPIKSFSIDDFGLKKHGFTNIQIEKIKEFYRTFDVSDAFINNEMEKFCKYSTRDVYIWNKRKLCLDIKAK